MKKKVLVALSGGVDSAVAALLLKEAGHEVSAVFMRTWMNEEDVFADCPWERDREDAHAVAEALGIHFEVLNLIEAYREKVVEYLVSGYKTGTTPNPDTMCNREIKFGVLLEYALSHGFDALATGHYCRKKEGPEGGFNLLEGIDKNKDQSYFLALIKQHQLANALFPVGELSKPEVRALAEKHNLPNAAKKDSQGICFLGNVPINDFLKSYIDDTPGPIVNTEGKVLGTHKGLHRYTLGQRRGIGVPSNTDFEKYVVVSKDIQENTLIVAFEHPDAPGLYTKRIRVAGLTYINHSITETKRLSAKPRYRDPAQAITFEPIDANSAWIEFDEPQRALASGQVIALYDGDILLGGGFYA